MSQDINAMAADIEAWQRKRRIEDAAPEMLALLRDVPVTSLSGAQYDAMCAWRDKVSALLETLESGS